MIRYPIAHNLKYGPPDPEEWKMLVRKAINMAGGPTSLAKNIRCCQRTIYRWQRGMPPIKRSYDDLLGYLNGN